DHAHRRDVAQDAGEGAGAAVGQDGVVDQVERLGGVGGPFLPGGDHGVVLGPRPLADQVADEVADAAVGQVDLVAGVARVLLDAVVEDVIGVGPGLHLVPHDGVVGVAALQGEAADVADVDVVGLAVGVAVAGELGVLDVDVGRRVGAGQDALLV